MFARNKYIQVSFLYDIKGKVFEQWMRETFGYGDSGYEFDTNIRDHVIEICHEDENYILALIAEKAKEFNIIDNLTYKVLE